jgi:hypothetical protein
MARAGRLTFRVSKADGEIGSGVMAFSGIAGLSKELAQQRTFLRERTPAYATLLDHLRNELAGSFGDDLARVWQDRAFIAWYDRPLLLLASLRYEALCEGAEHPLWSSIGDPGERTREPTADEVRAAVQPGSARFWDSLARRSVQTNETTRAVAWLWPACLIGNVDARTALHLVDVGTSAGLNLVADDLPAVWTDEHGSALGVHPLPPVVTRLGLDLAPLDVGCEDAARWLRACVWPSDRDRLERLEQAIAAFRSAMLRATGGPELETCRIEAAPTRLINVGIGRRMLIVQTIIRDYVPLQAWTEYERGLAALLEQRPSGSVLWVELELEIDKGQPPEQSARLSVHVAGRDRRVQTLILARTHPHPKQLFIEPTAVQALLGILRGEIACRTS